MSSAADATRAYLAKHDIRRLIQETVNDLCREKPDQPIKFLCELLKARQEASGAAPAAAATEPAPAAEATEEPAATAPAAGVSNDDKVAQIMGMKEQWPDNIAVQSFDKAYYDTIEASLQARFLKCLDSGRENGDSGMGCYANQPDDYEIFNPFFKAVLSKYHKVDLDVKKHVNNWSLEGVESLPEDGVLDLGKLGLPALSMRVRTGRNLKNFPLPGSMTKDDRVAMEKQMGAVFEKLIAKEEFGGRYVSITPGHENFVDEKEYQSLVDAHIMFKDMAADPYLNSAGISSDWPFGRGCYISEDKGFIIWVGEEDHLRIMCMQKGTILNKVFDRLKSAIDVVELLIEGGCAYSPDYGVVTSCPTNIGTGMRASVHIPLPNLTSDGTDKKAKEICKPLGLSVRGTGGEHTPIGADGTVDISPSARFCISEAEIVTALYNGLKLLKEKESEAAA
jgi:creatine kinase